MKSGCNDSFLERARPTARQRPTAPDSARPRWAIPRDRRNKILERARLPARGTFSDRGAEIAGKLDFSGSPGPALTGAQTWEGGLALVGACRSGRGWPFAETCPMVRMSPDDRRGFRLQPSAGDGLPICRADAECGRRSADLSRGKPSDLAPLASNRKGARRWLQPDDLGRWWPEGRESRAYTRDPDSLASVWPVNSV